MARRQQKRAASKPRPRKDTDSRQRKGGQDLATEIEEATRRLELADPDAGLGAYDRGVNRVAEAMGVTIFAILTSLIFANAVMRYLSDGSIVWAEEIVIGITPWLAVVGVFLAVRRQTMIRIDFFFEKFPSAWRRPMLLVGQIWSAAVFGYIAWITFEYVSFFGGDPTPVLEWPKGVFATALVVGPIAAALAMLAGAVRDHRTPPAPETEVTLERGGRS